MNGSPATPDAGLTISGQPSSRRVPRTLTQEIQLDLFYDYRTNVALYPEWHAYFRRHQPATLVLWGKNDEIFVVDGAAPYKRDLRDVEVHLLNSGHFALETNNAQIAALIREFLDRKIPMQRVRH